VVPWRAIAGSSATGPVDCALTPDAADNASAAPAAATRRLSRVAPSGPRASAR
jgi:hypothetical protein